MPTTSGTWFVGDYGDTAAAAFTAKVSGAVKDLTGYTAVAVRLKRPTKAEFGGSGTITVTNAATGAWTYAPASGEIDTAGTWYVQLIPTIGGGPAQGTNWVAVQVGSTMSGTVAPLLSVDPLSLYIDALDGDDAHHGRSASATVQSWERIEDLWPAYYRNALDINIESTAVISIDDGEHVFPSRVGRAQPIRVRGFFGQIDGTRTIGAVGANYIQDVASPWSTDNRTPVAGSNLFRVRFTSGAALGSIYTIQHNTTNRLYLAHAFENGATPSPGDTYVIEYPTCTLKFNDVQFKSPGPVIFEGVVFYGDPAGAGSSRIAGYSGIRVLQLVGGPFYFINCYVTSTSGRLWLTGASLRTYDVVESLVQDGFVNPNPDLIPGYQGFGMTTGDLFVDQRSDVEGCLVAGYIDMVAANGGVVDIVNPDILVVNQQDHKAGAIGRYSCSPNNQGRIRSTPGAPLLFFRGGIGYVRDVSLDGSAHGAGLATGARVTMYGVTGTVLAGSGVDLASGSQLTSEGSNTVTGPGGDITVQNDAGPRETATWAQAASWGDSVTAGRDDGRP